MHRPLHTQLRSTSEIALEALENEQRHTDILLRTNCTTQTILYAMYCCISIRLTVGVTATDTLLDLEPMLLTVSTDLQARGVLIRGSLVQNGIVSEYKYHRPKLITAAFGYQLFPCRFS